MTSPASTAPAAPAAPEQTHPCVRCGIAVPLDVAMCERCNPLGLAQPASSQVHGTVAVGIVLAVIVLAVVGRLSLAGIGPFEARVTDVRSAGAGLALTVTVRNTGTSAGTTSCRVTDPANRGVGGAAFVLSPLVPAGEEVVFEAGVRQFGSDPKPLAVECQSP